MTKTEINAELQAIKKAADEFFSQVRVFIKGLYPDEVAHGWENLVNPYDLARKLSPELRGLGTDLRLQIGTLGTQYVNAVKQSPLLMEADGSDIRIAFRKMAAAVVLRSYSYHESHVIAEEDRVFGMAPAEQSESQILPTEARSQFLDAGRELLEKLEFLLPTEQNLTKAIVAAETPEIRSYRPNTAFIMMQISTDLPKLEDIKNSLKEVFKKFGIKAIRSDEIEHQDVITQRILDEIATSEFLVADLTGARPSVYYEVGYAHALKRRPILYREKGTPLHFDLMVHNVPEYENITDLKKKLTARLAVLTGREPSE